MLLRHTTPEIKERKALTVNPAKTCQPIGAMYAALGIHGCLPHSHGSQGCYAYHRSALTRHYKEPVMAATSAFTEGASVFGGQANLLQVVAAVRPTGRFPRRLNGRQEKRNQDPDDGDNDEELDQGETSRTTNLNHRFTPFAQTTEGRHARNEPLKAWNEAAN